MHFSQNLGSQFDNKKGHKVQLKLRPLLRGIADDKRSPSGSLRDSIPSQQLYQRVGFVHYLHVKISVKLVSLESQYSSSLLLYAYYVSANLVDLPEVVLSSVRLPPMLDIIDATFEGCISCSMRSIPVTRSVCYPLPILKKPAQHSGRRKWVENRLIFTAERSRLPTSQNRCVRSSTRKSSYYMAQISSYRHSGILRNGPVRL